MTLGRPEDGWTLAKAETELRNVLADVDRGRWTPHEPAPEPVVSEVPTFHVFASEWIAMREPELAPRTVDDYKWALTEHLLPYFAGHALTEITIEEVDRYKKMKTTEGRLSPLSLNKTLTRLSQILETAVEYRKLPSNPAAGKRRRVKVPEPSRPHVEPEQLPALLAAAQTLECAGGRESQFRLIARPLLATLAGAGLRIGEALALEWRDVSLGGRTLRVRESKTDAGVREVDLTPALVEELADLKAKRGRAKPRDPVFGCVPKRGGSRGTLTAPDRHRVRDRILLPSVEAANAVLEEQGIDPIGPVNLHGLRRTYASLRIAAGDDPVYVAQQLGHKSPSFTMTVYAKAAKRRNRLIGPVREAFDQALEWASELAENGRMDDQGRSHAPHYQSEESRQTA